MSRIINPAQPIIVHPEPLAAVLGVQRQELPVDCQGQDKVAVLKGNVPSLIPASIEDHNMGYFRVQVESEDHQDALNTFTVLSMPHKDTIAQKLASVAQGLVD